MQVLSFCDCFCLASLLLTKIRFHPDIPNCSFPILKLWKHKFHLFCSIFLNFQISMQIVVKMQHCQNMSESGKWILSVNAILYHCKERSVTCHSTSNIQIYGTQLTYNTFQGMSSGSSSVQSGLGRNGSLRDNLSVQLARPFWLLLPALFWSGLC